MTFYLLLAAVFVVPLLLMLPALANRGRLALDDRETQNAQLARDRMREVLAEGDPALDPDKVRQEIEQELASDLGIAGRASFRVRDYRPAPLVKNLIMVLPLMALGVLVYFQTGSPRLADPGNLQPVAAPPTQQVESLEVLLAQLESRLAQEPDSIRGWELAASTYMSIQQYQRAEAAYRQLDRLSPGNPDYLAGWADALIMGNGNRYVPEARDKVMAALRVDPAHVNALWIAGLGESSLGNRDAALGYLESLKAEVAGDPAAVAQVEEMMAFASGEVAVADAAEEAQPESVAETVAPRQVSVELSLGEGVTLPDGATVFVVARAVDGPPAPLAVKRLASQDLPASLVLDSSAAMVAGHDIDSVQRLVVFARASATGEATVRPGDVTSAEVAVDFTAGEARAEVSLVLDQQLP